MSRARACGSREEHEDSAHTEYREAKENEAKRDGRREVGDARSTEEMGNSPREDPRREGASRRET
jgi:hypothetical protein